MEGPINKSVIDRLPSVIKGLDEMCQKTYIYLRLRKSFNEIARQLNLPIDEAREKINIVRNELIRAGQIDLIEDPKFVSIHANDPDTQDMPIASGELDIDQKLIIKEFLLCLKQTINKLPKHQSNILKFKYKYQMSAKDILDFSNKIGLILIPDKETSGLKEQDIFYALNSALKEVFKELKVRYSEGSSIKMENLKYIFEEIGI